MPAHTLVSVVITTKNEERNIANCLRSIAAQTHESVETIVVDNASTDRTKEMAREFTDKVYDKGPERSAQRNFGMIDKAAGEYVMFVDADMILAPCLVENCAAMLDAEPHAALHIPEIILGNGYFSRVRRFERGFYDGTPIDGARFFRKSVFAEVGGFDTSMSGPEDWDIDKKIKQKGTIGLVPMNHGPARAPEDWDLAEFVRTRGVEPGLGENAIFHNESDFDLKAYLSKKGYYAKSFDTYAAKWGTDDPDVRRQLGAWYRFVGVFVEQGRWKRLLARPDLSAGMYFLRFMVGLRYLARDRASAQSSRS